MSTRRLFGVLLIGALVLTGCGHANTVMSANSMPGMPSMSGDPMPMPPGDGLSASMMGYTFVPALTTLPYGTASTFGFRITGPDGQTVTKFEPEQSELLHFYLIRSDLTGFAHLHPTMATDGTWSVPLAALDPGDYRAYITFVTPDSSGNPQAFALSVPLSVPGTGTSTPLPPPSPTATVDGYTLTLSGQPHAGQESALTLSFSKDGQPVTDLQPYLDSYAHLSAFHQNDLAFAHLHPQGTADGDHGGPRLSFDATFPSNGFWRLFVQFQTAGVLHTAVFTTAVA